MARSLVKAVVVHGKKGPKLFLPGDDVPEWAAKLITNPHAWGGSTVTVESAGDEEGSSDEDDSNDEDGDVDDGEDAGGPKAVPPTSGRGSGRNAWATYATAHGVDVEEDMTRDDIIAACELAEVPIA